MTTGQKSLREVAEAAREAKLEESREQGRKNRRSPWRRWSPSSTIATRDSVGSESEGLEVLDKSFEDFEYVRDVRIFSGQADKGSGWKVVVDDVPFLFGDELPSGVPLRHPHLPKVWGRGSVHVPRAR